jgi:sugar phosphate isomerase/epimerase
MNDDRDPAISLARRDFLRCATGVLGGSMLLPRLAPERLGLSETGRDKLKTIGVQLYSVRDQMEKSVDTTLARVAGIGYREVEFAGYFNRTPAEIAARLKSTGLRAPSAHISLNEIRNKWPQTLDDASLIGHEYLVCAWIDVKERTTDGFKRVADEFNRAAEQARAHKIRFAYHNHDFEFKPLDGARPYDVLLGACDPKLVQMELDLYWINKAGFDPLVYFAKQPGRFPLVHVKDMNADGSMADVGAGKLPFGIYFSHAKQAGIKHFFVERDDPSDSFASIAKSYHALMALTF